MTSLRRTDAGATKLAIAGLFLWARVWTEVSIGYSVQLKQTDFDSSTAQPGALRLSPRISTLSHLVVLLSVLRRLQERCGKLLSRKCSCSGLHSKGNLMNTDMILLINH